MLTEVEMQGLGEFALRGFTLEHSDDHVLFLMHEGECIAVFSQSGATEESLQNECARHLVANHAKSSAGGCS